MTTTPVGPEPSPFVMAVLGAVELLIAAVRTGVVEHAVELGAQIASTRRSVTRGAQGRACASWI